METKSYSLSHCTFANVYSNPSIIHAIFCLFLLSVQALRILMVRQTNQSTHALNFVATKQTTCARTRAHIERAELRKTLIDVQL